MPQVRNVPSALAVFARVPALGRVKTRMQARFDPEAVLELHHAMLRDALDLAASVEDAFERRSIYWDAEPGRALRRRRAFASVEHRIQRGANLGERMHHAISEELSRGSAKAVLIGSDSPDLPRELLVEALERLDGVDWVLGPTCDGGYYLVGARRAAREPFRGIEWGTPSVLQATIARLEQLGSAFALLPEWYDLDRPEDLQRLARTSGGARNVRRWLRAHA